MSHVQPSSRSGRCERKAGLRGGRGRDRQGRSVRNVDRLLEVDKLMPGTWKLNTDARWERSRFYGRISMVRRLFGAGEMRDPLN